MTAVADALRAMLAVTDPVIYDPHSGEPVGRDDDLHTATEQARAALAAHDAAVAAGGWTACDGGDGEPLVYCGDTPAAMMFDADDAMVKAARIVECVNACEGIADPAGLVRALRDCVAALDSVAAPGSLQAAARDAGAAVLGGDA